MPVYGNTTRFAISVHYCSLYSSKSTHEFSLSWSIMSHNVYTGGVPPLWIIWLIEIILTIMQDAGNHIWMRDSSIQWLRNRGNFNAIIIQDNTAPPIQSTSFVFDRAIVHVLNFLLKSHTNWDIPVCCWQTWAFYRNASFSLNRNSWWNYRAYSPCPKMQT